MQHEANILRISLIFLVVLAAIIIAFSLAKNRVNYNEITEVRIKMMGTMLPNGVEYSLMLRDGVWVASRNEIIWLEDNVHQMPVDEAFVNTIIQILKENRTHKWSYSALEKEIAKLFDAIATDGTYYSFSMRFANGAEIAFREYERHPKAFVTVWDAFEKEFAALFGKAE